MKIQIFEDVFANVTKSLIFKKHILKSNLLTDTWYKFPREHTFPVFLYDKLFFFRLRTKLNFNYLKCEKLQIFEQGLVLL